MINRIKVNGLKSIDELDMDCTWLNLITGTNSSGKSTLIQAILLVFQNLESQQGLNGELVTLGDFRADVKNSNISRDVVEIELCDDQLQSPVTLCITEDQFQAFLPDRETESMGVGKAGQWKQYSKKLHYLSCSRIGAQDVYRKNYSTMDSVGKEGEYALFYLQTHKKDNLDVEICRDLDSVTLQAQVDYWMQYIVNTAITVEDVPGTDIVKAGYQVEEGKSLRPRNVGSGVSYIVSIIIMCLASKKDDVLIIENPEIHLHPGAQSRICEFLSFIASSGRQLFIETHSDHIFNGIRAGIARHEIEKEMVSVHFFRLDENHCTQKFKIEFGKRGRILNYTDGLFDQFDIDLNKMLDL